MGDPVPELVYLTLTEATHPIRNTWTQLHTEQLRELGFQIDFQAASVPDYVDRGFNTRSCDIYPLRYLDGFDPNRTLHDALHSEAAVEGGGNINGYQNPEYDEMFQEMTTTIDRQERQQLVYDMHEFICDRQLITPVLVQNRQMPYDTQNVTNPTSMPEFGLGSIYNFLSMEPAQGNNSDQLVWSQPEDLTTLNPLNPERGRVERNINRIVYDRVLRADTNAQPQPWMAESYEVVDDTTREVTLRDGLTWHDGEPVTTEDVVFTFEFGAEHSVGVESVYNQIESFDVQDERNMTINLAGNFPAFEINGLAGRDGNIIPQHIWQDVPDQIDGPVNQWTNPEPVGSGPFQVESFTVGEETVMSRHDAYGDAGFDTPNFAESVRIQAPDLRTTVRQLEDGTADFLPWELQVTDVQRFQQSDRYEMVDSIMTSIHYVTYNMREDRDPGNVLFGPPQGASSGNDRMVEVGRAVRRAMAYAVPKQQAIQVATGGTALELQAPISRALEFWYNEDVESFNLDLEAARSELESVGFAWDSDGRIHYPEGYPS